MDSQFTTYNSQFTNESQFTRESQRTCATKPTTHWHHPITSRWGLGHERDELGPDPLEALPARLKWYTASCTPWGRERGWSWLVVVACLILCLVGWLMVRGLCVVVCVWLFAAASWFVSRLVDRLETLAGWPLWLLVVVWLVSW